MAKRDGGDQPGNERTAKRVDGRMKFALPNVSRDSYIGHAVEIDFVEACPAEPPQLKAATHNECRADCRADDERPRTIPGIAEFAPSFHRRGKGSAHFSSIFASLIVARSIFANSIFATSVSASSVSAHFDLRCASAVYPCSVNGRLECKKLRIRFRRLMQGCRVRLDFRPRRPKLEGIRRCGFHGTTGDFKMFDSFALWPA